MLVLYVLCLLQITSAQTRNIPASSLTDELIAAVGEAYLINESMGDSILTGMKETPFTTLLVMDEYEFLFHHTAHPTGFHIHNKKDRFGNPIYYRKRSLNPAYLATFPLIDFKPTIVIGTPQNTNLSLTSWIVTILHEHVHQVQMYHPSYYENVKKLDLSGEDESGIWMIEYPFPYDNLVVDSLLHELAIDLVKSYSHENYNGKVDHLINEVNLILDHADYCYFCFQLWQEGLVRYFESIFLEKLQYYKPSELILTYISTESFQNEAQEFQKRQLSVLLQSSLSSKQRNYFYALGWAYGQWKRKKGQDVKVGYLDHMFKLK